MSHGTCINMKHAYIYICVYIYIAVQFSLICYSHGVNLFLWALFIQRTTVSWLLPWRNACTHDYSRLLRSARHECKWLFKTKMVWTRYYCSTKQKSVWNNRYINERSDVYIYCSSCVLRSHVCLDCSFMYISSHVYISLYISIVLVMFWDLMRNRLFFHVYI